VGLGSAGLLGRASVGRTERFRRWLSTRGNDACICRRDEWPDESLESGIVVIRCFACVAKPIISHKPRAYAKPFFFLSVLCISIISYYNQLFFARFWLGSSYNIYLLSL